MNLLGLHHVTAIAGDPRRNVQFYTTVLGLRLIKKTVNFDDPSTYHLYYGDTVGTPGSVLTFFPWMGIRSGRPGTGQAYATAFSVPGGALAFWTERLRAHGVAVSASTRRFGEELISFKDPDGMILELVATNERDDRIGWQHPEIPASAVIRGFHGVTLAVTSGSATASVLAWMGYRSQEADGQRTRYTVAAGGPGTYVDLLVNPALPRGVSGSGTVHHVAFRTPDDAAEKAAQSELQAAGLQVSPVMNRNYFHSIYYREPQGVLFEIATDAPGFTIDESVEKLGTALKLPSQYEHLRSEIESNLPSLG